MTCPRSPGGDRVGAELNMLLTDPDPVFSTCSPVPQTGPRTTLLLPCEVCLFLCWFCSVRWDQQVSCCYPGGWEEDISAASLALILTLLFAPSVASN